MFEIGDIILDTGNQLKYVVVDVNTVIGGEKVGYALWPYNDEKELAYDVLSSRNEYYIPVELEGVFQIYQSTPLYRKRIVLNLNEAGEVVMGIGTLAVKENFQ